MVREVLRWSVWGTVGAHTFILLHAVNAAIVLWKMKASSDAFALRLQSGPWLDPEHNRPRLSTFSCYLAIFPHLFPSLFTAALPLPLWFGEENM